MAVITFYVTKLHQKEEGMKKLVTLFIAVLMITAIFAGCVNDVKTEEPTAAAKTAEKTAEAAATQEEKSEETELTAELTLWSMPLIEGFEDVLDQLIAGYNELYPGVKINVEMLTWEGGVEKLQISLGTGTTPDIYIDGTARTAALPSKGVLVDVSDVITENQDVLLPSLQQIGKFKGSNYILPLDAMSGMALAVNATLAKELGTYNMLPADHLSWTHDDFYNFLEACTVAGKDQGIYGVALYAGSQTSDIAYYSMMLSNKGSVLNEDHTACIANGPANVAVVDLLAKLVSEGVAYPGATTLKDEDTESLFYSGKTVMMINGSPYGYAANMMKMADEGTIAACPEIEAYGYPTSSGTADAMITGSWGANTMVLFTNDADEAKIEAAKAFMNYYVDDTDAQLALCTVNGNTPPTLGTKVTKDNEMLAELSATVSDWTSRFTTTNFGILEPYWAEIRSNFYPELQAVFSNAKTSQEALDSFVEKVNEIIEKQ